VPKSERRSGLAGESVGRLVEDAQKKREATGRKRDRSWELGRTKATYDLPAEVIQRIKDIAQELTAEHPNTKVRVSDVARLLIQAGLEQYEAGELEVRLHPKEFTLFPD